MEIVKEKNHFLEVKIDSKRDIVNISGNKEGLKYLGEVCLKLSETVEQEHWHLSYAFYTLTKDSKELIVNKISNVEL